MKPLKRRSTIRINTDQAVSVRLEFVPGGKDGRPYIHFDAEHIQDFQRLTGFIDDKDVKKLKRMVDSLEHAKAKATPLKRYPEYFV